MNRSWPPICAIPGVRVGLGNIVTMFMLYIGGKWRSLDVMLVVILRCFVAAFITGQVMNLFYGVMGGICALGVMLLMRKLLPGENRENWLPLVGIMGALAHIAGQMLTAVIIYGNILVLGLHADTYSLGGDRRSIYRHLHAVHAEKAGSPRA